VCRSCGLTLSGCGQGAFYQGIKPATSDLLLDLPPRTSAEEMFALLRTTMLDGTPPNGEKRAKYASSSLDGFLQLWIGHLARTNRPTQSRVSLHSRSDSSLKCPPWLTSSASQRQKADVSTTSLTRSLSPFFPFVEPQSITSSSTASPTPLPATSHRQAPRSTRGLPSTRTCRTSTTAPTTSSRSPTGSTA
jgi:hypothetical protein